MSRLGSLRARLVLITVGLLAVGLTVGDAVVLTSLRGHLVRRVDNQLLLIGEITARVPVVRRRDGSPVAGAATANVLLDRLDLIGAFSLGYLGPDGDLVARVEIPADAGGPRLPTWDSAAVARSAGRPFSVADRSGGADWRVVVLPRNVPGSGGSDPADVAAVVVAASEADVDATMTGLVALCLGAGASLLVLLGLIGGYAVRRQLRPLRGIEATATAIAAGDLSRRVADGGGADTEVGRLVRAINGMLGRLDEAFAARARAQGRLRGFLADAGHELRTPLFAINGSAQLHRMGALDDPEERDRTMRRIESESARLARLATDLLLLARLDAEAETPRPAGPTGAPEPNLPEPTTLEPTPMDLRTLAADARIDVRALDPGREVRISGPDGGEPGSAPVLGDEARLRQVTANLVGNAIVHTPPGTPLRIGVGTVGDLAVWEIEDVGPGMTPDDARRVFDPFFRVDPSRGRAAGAGAGLGLAIVRALVVAHGGRVSVRTAPGSGTTMRVELPATPGD